MHNRMAVDAWLLAMRLVSVYMHGFRQCVWCLCIRWLMHRSMAVDAWLQFMRLVPVYTRADAQAYGSRCMALGHAFSVCTYAG